MSKLHAASLWLLFLVTTYLGSTGPVVHSASEAAAGRPQDPEGPAIVLQPVLSGLTSPVFVTDARDGSRRLFIVEQAGRIKVLQAGATSPTVFLDITARVLSGGERGLLGLTFHPLYRDNGRFFVFYTRQTDGALVIAEYRASTSNPDVADTSEIGILSIPHPGASNNNGGMIEFFRDDFLYIGTGDGGSANDPPNNAQNIDSLLGKILRIDIDHPNGAVPYSSPPSNPFFGSTPGADEIYSYGQRNPWRFSFDSGTDQIYLGDVGQEEREELDIVTLGGNNGWRVMEGSICNPNINGGVCTPPTGHILPISEYSHAGGRCSIIAGYAYRGGHFTLPFGTYVFGDYCTGEIFMMQSGLNASTVLLDTELNISSFGQDGDGEIYVVGLGGTVHRIANAHPPNYQGHLETADCTMISGWAWDANQPNTPISVDIYDSGTVIATVPANIFRQDLLNGGIGNGNHAFAFTTPASLKDGQRHPISVRFASTGIANLPSSFPSIICNGGPVYQGNVEVADCARISGWAWDANQPNTPISVDIFDGNALIATLAANIFRQDLLNAGIGNGSHGFSFARPSSLQDGQSHFVRVNFTFTNINLPGTPKSIACGGAVYQGNHELADCGRISGWAWNANQPNTPISVDIFDGNALIATATASIFRQDLLDAAIGNGSHGFSFDTPLWFNDGQQHSVRVKIPSSNINLPGTPRAITCNGAPVLQGNHEVADCSRISGWVWDANQPNTPINVDILDGQTFITTVVANQFRQDLLDAGIGNGIHAFSFTVPAGLKDGQTHSTLVRFSGAMTTVPNSPRNINCP